MNKNAHFSSQRVRAFLALLFGACGTLAFSPYDLWPAAIISLCGLLSVTLNRTTKQSFLLGFFWAFGLFASGVNWVYVSISNFSGMPLGINIFLIVLFFAYLSVYTAIFAGLLAYFCPCTNWWRLSIAAPVFWQLTEFLRSQIMTGFPWLQFGYSQISGPLKSIAPILGVDAITLILMSIAGLLVNAFSQKRVAPALIAIFFLILPLSFRQWNWFALLPEKTVNIAIVQGNISQLAKWSPQELASTLQIYLNETDPYIGKAPIIIWPESAIPDYEARQNRFLTMIDKQLCAKNSSLITGIIDAHTSLQGDKIYNSIIILGEAPAYSYPAKERYNKHHLVPFGEFIPLKTLLRLPVLFLNIPISSFSQGDSLQPQLHVKGYNLTAAICYEIILGKQLRDNFKPDTHFLLTLSNDAWFGDSIGPRQHFQMARMRALELGRPLLLSTNNGVTAAVDANGKVIAEIEQFARGVLEVKVTPTSGVTPYARFGSIPTWFITILLGICALVLSYRGKQ